MITSIRNPKIQWVRSLQARARNRRAEQAFVIEGVRLVEEAAAAGLAPLLVIHTPGLSERAQAALGAICSLDTPAFEVSETVFQAASDTQTPQGLLAVLPWPKLPLPPSLDPILIPDAVRDPGNLGTILRAAAAAGVGAVLLPPESVDPFAPKVVRAGMGAHFRLPIHALSWEKIQAYLDQPVAGLPRRTFLAAAGMGLPYTQADFGPPLALIVGGEAAGAGPGARELAHDWVHIPMPGGGESLNVALATGILLFEILRQRSRA